MLNIVTQTTKKMSSSKSFNNPMNLLDSSSSAQNMPTNVFPCLARPIFGRGPNVVILPKIRIITRVYSYRSIVRTRSVQQVSQSTDRIQNFTMPPPAFDTRKSFGDLTKATEAAAEFVARFVSTKVSERKRRGFTTCLQQFLEKRLKEHWYPEKPTLGQAHRCIRLNSSNPREPLIDAAIISAGLTYNDVELPLELTIWIDPDGVTCRFGEDEGSLSTIASF